jgi:hypothetical protein
MQPAIEQNDAAISASRHLPEKITRFCGTDALYQQTG